jgi:hypothetical protein
MTLRGFVHVLDNVVGRQTVLSWCDVLYFVSAFRDDILDCQIPRFDVLELIGEGVDTGEPVVLFTAEVLISTAHVRFLGWMIICVLKTWLRDLGNNELGVAWDSSGVDELLIRRESVRVGDREDVALTLCIPMQAVPGLRSLAPPVIVPAA